MKVERLFIRIESERKRKLKEAANKANMTITQYVEQALDNQLFKGV